MLSKQDQQMFTESKLKRLIKIAEIQKGVIRKQRKQLRIYTLYLDLLEQWLQKQEKIEKEVEIENSNTNATLVDAAEKRKDEGKAESLDEIFDLFLENTKDYKSVEKQSKKGQVSLNTEMEEIILKDKIISDISNSNCKVKVNAEPIVQSVYLNKKSETNLLMKSIGEDEIEIPIKERTSSGQIVGSSYQCFEIDFEILNEYIKEYLIDLETLLEALEKEKGRTQGYIFLLAKERKKVEITQQKLLKKFQLESKYMKMLRGLWKVGKTEYQKKVKQVLGLVYEYDDQESRGTNLEFIFSTPHLKWSVENVEFEQIMKQHTIFNLKMDLNEILDDMLQCNDNINEYNVIAHILNHDSEFFIEYEQLYFSKDDLDQCIDENINMNADDVNFPSNKTEFEHIQTNRQTPTDILHNFEKGNASESFTTQHEENMDEDDNETIVAESDEVEALLDDLETKNGNSLSSSASDIEKLLDDLEMDDEPEIAEIMGKKLDSDQILQDLQDLPKHNSTASHKMFNLTTPTGKLRKMKEECRDIFFSPQIMQPFQTVQKTERSSSLPTIQRKTTKRKICRTRERIKSDGCISRSTEHINDTDNIPENKPLHQLNKMNLFNIQTIFVDGEMVQIADVTEKTGFDSPRNQPRKLSFRKRSLRGSRPNL